MSAQQNADVVKRGYALFAAGNIEGLLSLVAEDVVWTVPSVEGAPFGGVSQGRAGVGEFFSSMLAAEEVLEFTQDEFIADAGKVAVTGRVNFRVRATGRIVESDYVHIFTVRDGKIQEFVEHIDTAAVAAGYRRSASAGA